jgi:hypothetical protein
MESSLETTPATILQFLAPGEASAFSWSGSDGAVGRENRDRDRQDIASETGVPRRRAPKCDLLRMLDRSPQDWPVVGFTPRMQAPRGIRRLKKETYLSRVGPSLARYRRSAAIEIR